MAPARMSSVGSPSVAQHGIVQGHGTALLLECSSHLFMNCSKRTRCGLPDVSEHVTHFLPRSSEPHGIKQNKSPTRVYDERRSEPSLILMDPCGSNRERERERERVCVCVCACASLHVRVNAPWRPGEAPSDKLDSSAVREFLSCPPYWRVNGFLCGGCGVWVGGVTRREEGRRSHLIASKQTEDEVTCLP